MEPLGNDRWRAEFQITELGRYRYTLEAWVDAFGTWWRDLAKRIQAGEDTSVDYQIGAQLIENTSRRASDQDVQRLLAWVSLFKSETNRLEEKRQSALGEAMVEIMSRYPDK